MKSIHNEMVDSCILLLDDSSIKRAVGTWFARKMVIGGKRLTPNLCIMKFDEV